MSTLTLKQRADFTHKFNLNEGRHSWLRLTPAYSVKIVNQILANSEKNHHVLDPFSGTATTSLCASNLGINSSTIELNPFLVWLGKTKTTIYSDDLLKSVWDHANRLQKELSSFNDCPLNPPPIHNIERWWNPSALEFLCTLKCMIDNFFPSDSATKSLLLMAFCRTMIKISNASFNHQSMSFKTSVQESLFDNDDEEFLIDIFLNDVSHIISTCKQNPVVQPKIIQGDSREISKYFTLKANLVITSPPYPNRMSYIRELRPYMYWLGFLKDAREAGEIDWQAIGGTWGIATSRLNGWIQSDEMYYPNYFHNVVNAIAKEENKNGLLLSRYIYKYFGDMWLHFSSLEKVLTKPSIIHYIIGNSTFYGTLVSTEKIFSDMLSELGFSKVTVTPLRKRNSKKELYEFDVSATLR